MSDWTELNGKLRDAGEREAKALLDEELRGRGRAPFLLRIHSRLNRVRAHRERGELLERATKGPRGRVSR